MLLYTAAPNTFSAINTDGMFRTLMFIVFIGLVTVSTSCDKNEVYTPNNPDQLEGTGFFVFDSYQPLKDKPIRVFYHIPSNVTSSTPILLVFHGNGRDALESRDALINKANQLSFIVIVPEFSTQYFPGSSSYHMANIFTNGNRPSPSTLNDEDEWTFMVMDPIFEKVKNLTGNTTSNYDLFGHSAGAQITHRFVTFEPNAKYNRVIGSAAGWYNLPSDTVDFPYGLRKSPAEAAYLGPVFEKPFTIIVGTEDTDPNSASLRHTPEADAQGYNRYDRAIYYYENSRNIAVSKGLTYKWQYKSVPNAGHDFALMSSFAADLLYK